MFYHLFKFLQLLKSFIKLLLIRTKYYNSKKIISFSYSGFVVNVSELWRELPVELLPILHAEGVILYGYTSSSLQEVALSFQWRSTYFEVSLYLPHFPTLSDQVVGLEGYQ